MKILFSILKFFLCLFVSYILFFYITSDFISFFFQGSFRFEQILYIICFAVQTILIYYVFTHSNLKEITPLQVKLVWLLYACIMVILLFGRSYIDTSINLNVLELFSLNSYSFFQNLFNFLLFIPIGFLFKVKNKITDVLLKAILLVFLIECLQLITHRGIFDINDIILDTCGIVFGYYLSPRIPNNLKFQIL